MIQMVFTSLLLSGSFLLSFSTPQPFFWQPQDLTTQDLIMGAETKGRRKPSKPNVSTQRLGDPPPPLPLALASTEGGSSPGWWFAAGEWVPGEWGGCPPTCGTSLLSSHTPCPRCHRVTPSAWLCPGQKSLISPRGQKAKRNKGGTRPAASPDPGHPLRLHPQTMPGVGAVPPPGPQPPAHPGSPPGPAAPSRETLWQAPRGARRGGPTPANPSSRL